MDYIPRRKPSPPSDKFSFPPPPSDPDQFEFGSSAGVTAPGSPNSPADHLFSNGKLLPHVFPIPYNNFYNYSYSYSYSRSTSRTSSSRDSLMSSRSNSISSNCSSARTSTSDAAGYERKPLPLPLQPPRTSSGRTRSPGKNRGKPAPASPAYYCHGSSQRWQLIAAAPVLCHQGSSRSRKGDDNKLDRRGSRRIDDRVAPGRAKSSFGRRILKSLVAACKECHAIQSTTGAVEL